MTQALWRSLICWKKAKFPKAWKAAKLMLLSKDGRRPLTEASSFRPISLLGSTAKLYERLVLGRKEELVNRSGSLSLK